MTTLELLHQDLDLLFARGVETHKTDDLIAVIKIYPRVRNLTDSVKKRINKVRERLSSLERRMNTKSDTLLEIEDSLSKFKSEIDDSIARCQRELRSFSPTCYNLDIRMESVVDSKTSILNQELQTVLVGDVLLDVSSKQVKDVIRGSCLLISLLSSENIEKSIEFARLLKSSYHSSYSAYLMGRVKMKCG